MVQSPHLIKDEGYANKKERLQLRVAYPTLYQYPNSLIFNGSVP